MQVEEVGNIARVHQDLLHQVLPNLQGKNHRVAVGYGKLPQGRLEERKEPVDNLNTTRGEAVVDSGHEDPQVQLPLGCGFCWAREDGIYHRQELVDGRDYELFRATSSML